MPLVYVGRKTIFHGRPLWEILLNLKNFGAGRIVTRHTFSNRYPEVTFYRIIKANPLIMEYPQDFRGTILCERTFRGIKEERIQDLGRTAYKPDFFLIPKHEEEAFMNSGSKPLKKDVIYPSHLTVPYLWQELIKRDKAAEGLEATPEDFKVPCVYHHFTTIQVAKEGQEPSFTFDGFVPERPELYTNCNPNRSQDGKVGIEGEKHLFRALDSQRHAAKYKKNLLVHPPNP